MRSTETDPRTCWNCGKVHDAVSDLTGDAVPKPGDVIICIDCGAPAIFTENGEARQPTDEEVQEILQDEGALLHMAAVAMLHGARVGIYVVDTGPDEVKAETVSGPGTEIKGMRFI